MAKELTESERAEQKKLDDYYDKVSKHIKSLRESHGQTQEHIAIVLGKKDYSNYQKIESGRSRLTLFDAKKLAKHYKVPVNEILNPYEKNDEDYFLNEENGANHYGPKNKVNINIELDGSDETLEKSLELLKKVNGLL
ncbi:helix-turn-helix domain-containing protein [Belliella pelovolcani]|uniref:helix-turn-helix domain-containing protein n=1 Tax=Belliella pelovolcani TaxID=529505 RepID=UPI00391C7B47